MKTKHIVGVIPAFALLVFWFANAYATFDSHVHTTSGTIDSYLNCSPYGSHKLRVFAPSAGRIDGRTWKSGVGYIHEVWAQNGNCNTDIADCSYDNVLFTSWTANQTSGTGYAYFADANNTNLPNCSSN